MDEVGRILMEQARESRDEAVRETAERKEEWHIHERNKPNTLATLFGEVKYHRTYYKHKEDHHYSCLSDILVGIEAHDKMDLSLKAKCVENAVDGSYRKSGKEACDALELSGQTVMNAFKWLGPVPLREAGGTEERGEGGE